MRPIRSPTRWTTTRADDGDCDQRADAATGVVTVANNTLLDYETTTSHNITVRATSSDTSTNTAGFTINLTDDNTEFSISAVSDSQRGRPTKSAKAPPTARSSASRLWPPTVTPPIRSPTRWTMMRADGLRSTPPPVW